MLRTTRTRHCEPGFYEPSRGTKKFSAEILLARQDEWLTSHAMTVRERIRIGEHPMACVRIVAYRHAG